MIDYAKIAVAIEYYKNLGYQYIEVPWVVSEEAILTTIPPGIRPLWETSRGHLVGSGEQSFLQMAMDKKLSPGKYVCVTPCFRDEFPDDLHKNWFLKVELIRTDSTNLTDVGPMVMDALLFFRKYDNYASTEVCDASADPISAYHSSIDIISSNGIELGSYGIREHNGFRWIYGTGCAEPRLTYAIGHSKKLLETP